MRPIHGGDKAPRAGKFERTFIETAAGAFVRPSPPIELEAGDPFPGGPDETYEVHELRSGEVVPCDGVWFNSVAGTEHKLKAGDKFPGTDNPAAITGRADFMWLRES